MSQVPECNILKALSEPTRLRIVSLLAERELCVSDLAYILNLPQSTVSRHLAQLKSTGLVIPRRDAKWVHYRLKISTNPLFQALSIFFQSIKQQKPFKNDLDKQAAYFNNKNFSSS